MTAKASIREQMLVALGRRFDDACQRLLGEIADDLVVAVYLRDPID